MSRKALTNYHYAARRRAANQAALKRLEHRLDLYVAKGESMKPGTKGRKAWLAKAEATRQLLRHLSH